MNQELINAARHGDLPVARKLVRNNPKLVDYYSEDGWTPLHLAAHYGHLETARILLQHGADVLAVSRNAMVNYPLHAAVAGNHTGMVALLLDNGADVNKQQHGGWTPLHGAVNSGNLEMVKLLAESGADINAANDAGVTVLSIAIEKEHLAVIEYLRGNGAR